LRHCLCRRLRVTLCITHQILWRSVKPRWDRAIFQFSNMADAAILDFEKLGNFNSCSAIGDQCASSRQISSKSVKQFQRYHDLTVLQDGGCLPCSSRHLGFVGRVLRSPARSIWRSLSSKSVTRCDVWEWQRDHKKTKKETWQSQTGYSPRSPTSSDRNTV